MALKNTSITVTYRVWDMDNGGWVNGDTTGHTLFVIKDGVKAAATNAPAVLDGDEDVSGYKITLTADEMNGSFITVDGYVSGEDSYLITPVDIITETAARAGNQMDIVNAPNATAVTAIQNGLALNSTVAKEATSTVITNQISVLDSTVAKDATVAKSTDLSAAKTVIDTINGNVDAKVSTRATPSDVSDAADAVIEHGDGDGGWSNTATLTETNDKVDAVKADTVKIIKKIEALD